MEFVAFASSIAYFEAPSEYFVPSKTARIFFMAFFFYKITTQTPKAVDRAQECK